MNIPRRSNSHKIAGICNWLFQYKYCFYCSIGGNISALVFNVLGTTESPPVINAHFRRIFKFKETADVCCTNQHTAPMSERHRWHSRPRIIHRTANRSSGCTSKIWIWSCRPDRSPANECRSDGIASFLITCAEQQCNTVKPSNGYRARTAAACTRARVYVNQAKQKLPAAESVFWTLSVAYGTEIL